MSSPSTSSSTEDASEAEGDRLRRVGAGEGSASAGWMPKSASIKSGEGFDPTHSTTFAVNDRHSWGLKVGRFPAIYQDQSGGRVLNLVRKLIRFSALREISDLEKGKSQHLLFC